MTQFIKDQAEDAKKHLEKFTWSVTDLYCDAEELEITKSIFTEVLGEKLVKRVTFIPRYK